MNISDVNNDGIGMDGMDPVAHFNGEPLRGSVDFRETIDDVTYHFVSEENMNNFMKEPAKYIPIAGAYPVGTNVDATEIKEVNGQIVGNKTLGYRRNLEDARVSMDNNVPNDIKEDGSVEMQNLSDSEK